MYLRLVDEEAIGTFVIFILSGLLMIIIFLIHTKAVAHMHYCKPPLLHRDLKVCIMRLSKFVNLFISGHSLNLS